MTSCAVTSCAVVSTGSAVSGVEVDGAVSPAVDGGAAVPFGPKPAPGANGTGPCSREAFDPGMGVATDERSGDPTTAAAGRVTIAVTPRPPELGCSRTWVEVLEASFATTYWPR